MAQGQMHNQTKITEQNILQKCNHINMVKWFSRKVPRYFNEKMIFLRNKCSWKYLISTCKQWNLPHTIYIKPKWVIPLDAQAKNIKLLEENTGEKSLLSCLGKVFICVLLGFDFFFFLEETQKTWTTKEKHDKLYLTKIMNFVLPKTSSRKWKDNNLGNRRKYLHYYLPDRKHIPNILLLLLFSC